MVKCIMIDYHFVLLRQQQCLRDVESIKKVKT